MTIDVAKVRNETPGCARVAHLNNAGAALPPRPVMDAVTRHLELEAMTGGYEAAEENAEALDRFYDAVAGLIGAHGDEIAYVENATRAWDLAFYGIRFAPGERVLTTTTEYSSNAIAYRQRGVQVDVVPDDADGTIDLDALEAELRKGGVRLVSLNHVPTSNGLINPAAEVGRLCRAAGVLFLLDACQSVGQIPLDVDEIGCDLMSATGRKFLRGPRGTGFLYARREVLADLEPPMLDNAAADWHAPDRYEMRPDAKRFETWERYMAGQIGLGVAADYASALGMDAIAARIDVLATRLRSGLAAKPGVTVHDRGVLRSGTVTFTVDGRPPAEIVREARARGVNVNVAQPVTHGYDPDAVDAVVRASVHYYNDEDEVDRLLELI
ncbi:aminotransferase class V-fold PLP-dependent enzyme [Actinomadura logoneensis]|uniref:Aminotransferase class V-fold PLP-dependent enzyme n=1 Tax=Actinomadura logoneensis TaxID=2293572 RepID=A0A372JP45_9ACTN|nr:aminotransferase class V-fold PLP-dependent enzyme [Actinomadura logoneensis]RFU41108.1 aminotransferase class V-fold PLP-dependent enzyme [Actinomadura logoneensis]